MTAQERDTIKRARDAETRARIRREDQAHRDAQVGLDITSARTCALDRCDQAFTPRSHNQLFCHRNHQEEAYRHTERGKESERNRKRTQRARVQREALAVA